MRLLQILAPIFCVAVPAFAQVETMFSDRFQPPIAITSFTGSNLLAGSFVTDETPGLLSTVTVPLFGHFIGFGDPIGLGPCQISVYSDFGGKPGTNLVTLSGLAYPTNGSAAYVFTNTAPMSLLPNTRYWVVASTPASGGNTGYKVSLTSSTSTDAGTYWTLGLTKHKFGTEDWLTNVNFYFQFGVDMIPQPPQTTITLNPADAVRPVTVIYPEPDFPFGLYETDNPAANDWHGPVGLTSHLTNHVIVKTPMSGPKMFYRLFRL